MILSSQFFQFLFITTGASVASGWNVADAEPGRLIGDTSSSLNIAPPNDIGFNNLALPNSGATDGEANGNNGWGKAPSNPSNRGSPVEAPMIEVSDQCSPDVNRIPSERRSKRDTGCPNVAPPTAGHASNGQSNGGNDGTSSNDNKPLENLDPPIYTKPTLLGPSQFTDDLCKDQLRRFAVCGLDEYVEFTGIPGEVAGAYTIRYCHPCMLTLRRSRVIIQGGEGEALPWDLID